MKKKLLIILSALLLFVVALIAIALTVFSLKSVTVDFRTSTLKLNATQEEIVEKGDFGKGSVLVYNKNRSIEKIENAFPYIKVINIETVFPSKFVIHVAERQEVYAFTHENKTYYCDEELKVLCEQGEGAFSSGQSNPILLEGLEVRGEVKVGKKLKVNFYQDVYSSLLESNLKLSGQKEIIEKITFSEEYDQNVKKTYQNVSMKMFNGQTYKIVDINYGLRYKANRAYNVYSSIYTWIGMEYNTSDGQTITLTQEHLDGAMVEIRSYYDRASHKESETYFALFPTLAQEIV